MPDLTEIPVTSADQVMELLAKAGKNRSVTATAMNAQSSRSHSLLEVVVKSRMIRDGDGPDTPHTMVSALTLIDLAGSERLGKSEGAGWAPASLRVFHIFGSHVAASQPSESRK